MGIHIDSSGSIHQSKMPKSKLTGFSKLKSSFKKTIEKYQEKQKMRHDNNARRHGFKDMADYIKQKETIFQKERDRQTANRKKSALKKLEDKYTNYEFNPVYRGMDTVLRVPGKISRGMDTFNKKYDEFMGPRSKSSDRFGLDSLMGPSSGKKSKEPDLLSMKNLFGPSSPRKKSKRKKSKPTKRRKPRKSKPKGLLDF